jgi:hypothetical protein
VKSVRSSQLIVGAGQEIFAASHYTFSMKNSIKMVVNGGLALALSMFLSGGLVTVFSLSLAAVSRL